MQNKSILSKKHCQIPNTVNKLYCGGQCGIAYIGGSVTICRGASNTAETSWRALFQKYLYKEFHSKFYCHIGEIFSGLGACPSSCAAFMLPRNVLPNKPALAFVEFCLNDRHVPDKILVQKGVEGIIRQLLTAKEQCEVILLGAGCNPTETMPDGQSGLVDHSLHREIAQHYDLPFFDLQDYIHRSLEERGQTWTDVIPEYDYDLNYHLNDYGQGICFEAMRESFEKQIALYKQTGWKGGNKPVPDPIVSDELQFVKLIDPSKKNNLIEIDGQWEKKPSGLVPWYFDNIMMGKPGAKMSLVFEGTAVIVWGLMSYNGLKVNATLDGKEIIGPYLKYSTEFGKGFILAHGLPHTKHVLHLTVAEKSQRHNKLENPTAQIGYLGIACKPEA